MLAWVRARAANQLATDGAHWADIFSNHSAGIEHISFRALINRPR